MGCDMYFDLAHLQPCSGKSLVWSLFLYVYKIYPTSQLLQYIIWMTLPLMILFIDKKKQGNRLPGFWPVMKKILFNFIVYYTCADLGGGGVWGDLTPPSLQNSNSLNMPQTPPPPFPLSLANTKNCRSPYPGKLFWMGACYITITEDNHDNCTCYWLSSWKL